MVRGGRRILLGTASALTLAAGAYIVAAIADGGEKRVAPDFIGAADFGAWRLICVPGAPALAGLLQESAAPATNACRVNQEVPLGGAGDGATGQVVLAVNLSLVGSRKIPALMVRLPATAQMGDMIGLRLDNGHEVKTPVRDCEAAQCIAAGNLSAGDWTELLAAKAVKVRFPTNGGRMVLVDLKLDGLSAAIAAMRQADGG
ncbi:MAG: hypothetical protein EXR00_07295 [Alphaproteobacteria bacterium]|nr:hypothetical protein [Alphaproteobacteria bacterium]